MPMTQVRRLALAAMATGLGLAATSTPAAAAPRTPQQAEFYRAVVTCEDRTGRAALRGCVYDLTTPEPQEAEIYDLWWIFSDCLSFADRTTRNDEDFEDAVNDCLGL
jgi:hypothetical protein